MIVQELLNSSIDLQKPLTEMLDSKITFQTKVATNDHYARYVKINGRIVTFEASITDLDEQTWELSFHEKGSSKLSGSGGEFQVFSALKLFIQEFIHQYHPQEIYFNGEGRQGELYDRLFRTKHFSFPKYEFTGQDQGHYRDFYLTYKG